jgi:hypothetical protein
MAEAKFASVKFAPRFVEAARKEAALFHRSIAGQIEHWAELGRAIEAGFPIDLVRAALEGRFPVEKLPGDQQEAFFDRLGGHLDTPSPAAEAFFAARREKGGGVGLDDDGALVRALPGGKSEKINGQ